MNSLSQTDFERLGHSFISREIAEQAKLRRVNEEEGAAIVGRKRNANSSYSGIVFPYFWPLTENPHLYRLRRDSPDLDRSQDGTYKQKGKYLCAPNSRNYLYFPPNVSHDHLTDITLPIVITEGEKKALALYRLSTEDLTIPHWHYVPLALGGVWNFRGTIGKTTSANGELVTVKGFLPDFDLLTLPGRSVKILFDANARTNRMVERARRQLCKELQERGAKVTFIDLPTGYNINGIDDLLGVWEAEHGTAYAINQGLDLLDSQIDSVEESDKGSTQSAKIIRIVEKTGASFFHTNSGETFATIQINSHAENHKINSRFFREWIGHRYWNEEQKVPSTKALQDAINALKGRARFASPLDEVSVRLAESNGRLYLDMANENWEVIEISRGGWRILNGFDAPVKFRRPKGLLPLVTPELGECPLDISRWINVTEEHLPLLAIWLIACLRIDKPFPVLILNGEQGSAKSTTTRVLKRLFDPNLAELRTAPRDERDLMIAATNGWILAFDNLSKIPDWLSDAFCRLSTGGGFATRTLYENDEETIFSAKRPLIINGITELATRPDLLDRALIINCPNISKSKRRDEETFWLEFESARPKLLGSFLSALSQTMKNVPGVRLTEHERMADFARLGAAAEAALGLKPGTFQHAYSSNRRDAIEIAVESSATAVLVIAFMKARTDWTGSSTELAAALTEFAEQNKGLGIKVEDLPKRPNALSGELKKVAPNLRANGIEFKRAKSGGRTIALQKVGESSPTSSDTSIASDYKGHEPGDVGFKDDGRDDHRKYSPIAQPLQSNTLDATADVGDEFQRFSRSPEYQERVAIMIIDGGLSAAEAEHELNVIGH